MANYLYISDTPRGSENIGLDEFFLDRVRRDDLILFFYVNENAVIIGKNQNPWKECDLAAMERDGVELTRRVSGGGAVYHDAFNLNYSFLAGEDRYDPEAFQRILLNAVRSLGAPCEFSGRNDLLSDGKKISGTAFAARRGRHMHHGTLLIDTDLTKLSSYLTPDPKKIRSKGIDSVRSRVMNLRQILPGLTVEQAREAITSAFEERFGPYSAFVPTDEEKKKISAYRARHASWEWRMGLSPKFDLAWDERFSWGGVEILLSFENCVIREAHVFSDAMDIQICPVLEEALVGVPLRREALLAKAANLSGEALEAVTAFAKTV